MRSFIFTVLGIAAMAAVPAQADPTFSGTAVGSWSNPVAGAENPSPTYTITNLDSSTGGKAIFSFGQAIPTPNVFTFDGAGSDSSALVSAFAGVSSGQLFDVGHFTYLNGTTNTGTAVDSVSLGIALSLTSPSDADPAASFYSYNFGIDLTPNTTGNPLLDADIVTILNGITATTFTSGGSLYTLALQGFSTDGGVTFTSQFLSPEGSTATADIYARIIPSVTDVPEPFTVSLFGAGLAGVSAIRRRRKKVA